MLSLVCGSRGSRRDRRTMPCRFRSPDGRTIIVDTPEDHDRLMPDGWETTPLAVHQQRPVTHHGFLGANNDPLAVTIREVLAQVLDERDLTLSARTRVIP